jgi:TolB-like protein/class 3 adenylate cyclase/Tfp pilus assembly protein PilF
MNTTRRLAAILAADVVGYSRLMGADEVATLETLKAHRRELVDPAIAAHHGRIVKTTGDGMLVEFASAVDAVNCAMAVQTSMADRNNPNVAALSPRIVFRIGINVGDIIIDNDDIFGDGVNVASRVEAECEPGGVYLSANAFEQVRSKTSFSFDDMGERLLKNIDRPIRVYSARQGDPNSAAVPFQGPTNTAKPLALPDKPSLAVLPFQNMSGDPEQEYFADGMVEDIITALSRFKSLFVIARNSSFTYKGRAVDIKRVGRELGVRSVLEGSVRKAGPRVRITGQLIEAATDRHLWADKFDGALDDVFALQDQVTTRVVGAIAPLVEFAEIERAKRKPVVNLNAYDLDLQATAELYRLSKPASERALELLNQSIDLDPDFAKGHCLKAFCYSWRKINGWMINPADEMAEAERHARRALEMGNDDALILAFVGYTLAAVIGDFDDGMACVDRALEINPNLAAAWGASAWIRVFKGQLDLAIEHAAIYMRLSPLDPNMQSLRNATASAHMFAGRFEEAASWAKRALQAKTDFHPALRLAAAAEALAGNMDAAQKYRVRLQQLDPTLRLGNVRDKSSRYQPQHFAVYLEGLRKAGLPE